MSTGQSHLALGTKNLRSVQDDHWRICKNARYGRLTCGDPRSTTASKLGFLGSARLLSDIRPPMSVTRSDSKSCLLVLLLLQFVSITLRQQVLCMKKREERGMGKDLDPDKTNSPNTYRIQMYLIQTAARREEKQVRREKKRRGGHVTARLTL